ncbi:MAG: hypothetical protein RLZZ330_1118 [Actinomycetota bacterium]
MENVIVEAPNSTFLGELFKKLEPHDKATGIRTKQTDKTFNGEPIFAGRDSSGNPHLLIPLPADSVFEPAMLTNYIGIEKRELTHPNGEKFDFIDVFCLVNDVDELFAPICQEITDALSEKVSGHPAMVLDHVNIVVQRWREILRALENKELSGNQITGLIGELLTLRGMAERSGAGALAAWFGQDKTRHDFEFANFAVESKASTILSRKTCSIHGLNQLAASKDTSLKIAHFQIERASEGLTLELLIHEIAPLVGGTHLIQEKMSGVWPLLNSMPTWFSTWKFKVVSATLFEVDEDFPKITASSISTIHLSSISDVQYSINLTDLPATKVGDSTNWRTVFEL